MQEQMLQKTKALIFRLQNDEQIRAEPPARSPR